MQELMGWDSSMGEFNVRIAMPPPPGLYILAALQTMAIVSIPLYPSTLHRRNRKPCWQCLMGPYRSVRRRKHCSGFMTYSLGRPQP